MHGDKHLHEKLGRNDPCPCGSAKSFQALLPQIGLLLMAANAMTTGVNEQLATSPKEL